MATALTSLQWIEILQDMDLTKEIDIEIIKTLYSFENHEAPASDVGRLLGYAGKAPHAPLNSEMGRYAKRIATKYEIDFTARSARTFKYWDLFFDGYDKGRFFIWRLKPYLAEALAAVGLTDEIRLADELPKSDSHKLREGMRKVLTVNAYERNPTARRKCIEHWGTRCVVCGFDFHVFYGDVGQGFIHVHHLTPIASIGESYQIDPVNDLRPVCANCHAMMHRTDPPLEVDGLRQLIDRQRHDRSVKIIRVINATSERVFAAWTDPEQLAQWWGPNGFTNTIHRFELKPEGVWDFTMHGPNGQDFHNTCVFRRIEAPDYLEFDHLKEMHFYKAMVRFTEVDGGTRIEWTMRFDTVKELAPIRAFIERANEENMDKLQALCTGTS